jgi:predicted metal-dependent phosphoesterase TrpH
MVVADLHVHTTNSDGSLAPAAVPAAAERAGVGAVAITDHDRLPPGPPERQVDGVTVVGGIELRVEADAGRVDLLGYFARETADLTAEIERIQADRIERGRAIVERVEEHTGVTLDVDLEPGVGRPHVARAIEESDASYDYQEAFDRLIGSDGPCYVPREVSSFDRGADLLAGACRVLSLAHPLRYPDPEAALALSRDPRIDGIEARYPYAGSVDDGRVAAAVDAHDLVVTGGSDAHDERLGIAGLSLSEYRAFRDRAAV